MLNRRGAQGYGLALLATAVAVGLRALLELVVGEPPPFIIFFPAVLVSGWWGGRGAAMLCVAVSALFSAYLWDPPVKDLGFNPAGTLNLLLFIIVATSLALMSSGFRQARDRTESARQRLERFLESTGDAFMAFDSQWRYVYVNSRAAHFARLPPDQMIGRRIFELFPDITNVPFFKTADKVMRDRIPMSVESFYAPLDTWFENDIYPLDDGGIGVFYRDVTERRRASEVREELLRREQMARSQSEAANRLKDEFLATLSHELRTPLNAIIGWANLLVEGRLDRAERIRALQTIQRNARAQAHLIEDLLDVSRIISGKMRLEVQAVELGGLLEAALDAVRPAAEAKGIHLHVTIDPRATVVNGDPARLQQIAWNLLSNAIKFTSKGGQVELRLKRVNSLVELIVSDTGIGIAPHMLQRIFDRFAQVDGTSSREYHGLGLGLALVRHLVEAHGGSVWADSQGEGRGATFTVQLPLRLFQDDETGGEAYADRGSLIGDANASPALHGVSILAVEDDSEARELLVRMLTAAGATIRTVQNVPDALAELDRALPDVLLSDIEMPGEDGYSLIRKVRARSDGAASLPAIAVTAYARIEDRARALREGFDNHIAKPVYVPELMAVITRAFAMRSGAHPGARQ
jgi:signal transduction histidine kinase/ActR/RegA family two-component response regulator